MEVIFCIGLHNPIVSGMGIPWVNVHSKINHPDAANDAEKPEAPKTNRPKLIVKKEK